MLGDIYGSPIVTVSLELSSGKLCYEVRILKVPNSSMELGNLTLDNLFRAARIAQVNR